MRVACVLIRNLAVQLSILDNPDLQQRPVVIGGSPREARVVYDASEEAETFGVGPGLSLRQAYALCPEAVFVPADEKRYRQVMDEVAGILDDFSPVVEVNSLGAAFIDISGVPDEEALARQIITQVHSCTGLRCRTGISGGRFFSGVAALTTDEGLLIVPPGEDKAFVAPKSIDLLPASIETRQRIRYLGLRTIGQMADFPPESLVAQFGTDGVRYHELASGIDQTPLTPRRKPATITVTADLEPPATVCLQVMHACLVALEGPLQETRLQGKACREMLVRIRLVSGKSLEGKLRFRQPTASIGHIQHRLHTWLEGGALSSPVVRLELALTLTREKGTDLSLWSGAAAPRQSIVEVARNLRERLGYQPLKRLREVDPDARLPERRFGLTDVQG